MKTLQIRNVPEDIHRELRSRAAAADLSLSDYLLGIVTETAEKPRIAEVLARADARPGGVASTEVIVEAIREGRDGQ